MGGLPILVALGVAWASLLLGAGSAFAAAVDPGAPPANTAPPVITGTPEVGQTLSCSQGSWDNLPTAFAYQWNRDGLAIAGATSTAYVAAGIDAAHQLTCSVSASNTEGSNTATSASLTVTAVPGAPTSPGSGRPAATLPALPKVEKVIESPSNKRCVSQRKFQIRIRRVQNVTFVSARVFVNGKRVKVVSGERLTAPVNLRGLPTGRFAARIEVTTSDGRKLTHTRKYRTCTPKRGGKRKHRL